MSQWCSKHPRYEAKREPDALCRQCWKLYFYRFPEKKMDYAIAIQEMVGIE